MQFPSAKEIEGLWLRVELQLATSFSRSRFSTSTIKTQNEQMSMLHTEINTYKCKYVFCLSIQKKLENVWYGEGFLTIQTTELRRRSCKCKFLSDAAL